MLRSTTLRGLDDALIDLQNAIEHLPDGQKKKQLLERFQRLQNVRSDIENPQTPQKSDYLPWVLLGAGIVVAIMVLLVLLREQKEEKSSC